MKNIILSIVLIIPFSVFSQCDYPLLLSNTPIGSNATVKSFNFSDFPLFDSITVLIESPYLYMRTKLDETNDLIQKVAIAENIEGNNNLFNFRGNYLIDNSVGNTSTEYEAGTYIHNNGDDIAPISINQTFIGGNHGVDKIRNIESTGHGKTNVDVGSEWTDGNSNLWYIIKIVDVNNLWMLSSNIGASDIWAFRSTIVSPLTHSQNGTNTSNISFTTITNSQMIPAVKNNSIVISLDGGITSADGLYRAKIVDVNNDYEIVNPASALDNLIANVGTSSPLINVGNAVVRDSIIYSFQENGACTISNKWENLQVLDIGYIGGTQALNILGDITIYMPRTLTNVGNDYNQKIPYNSNLTSVNFTSSFWSNPLLPPDRIVEESDLAMVLVIYLKTFILEMLMLQMLGIYILVEKVTHGLEIILMIYLLIQFMKTLFFVLISQ